MRPRSGMSLLETLIVMGIVLTLLALAVPAIQRARSAADGVGCKSRLGQIGIALANFHNDYGRFPPPQHVASTTIADQTIMTRGGWRVQLLPYLEQTGLWRQSVAAWEQSKRPYEVPPHVGYITPVSAYSCPLDTRLRDAHPDPEGRLTAFSSYLCVTGSGRGTGRLTDDGAMGGIQRAGFSMSEILDGASNTIIVGERPPPNTFQAGRWYTSVSAWGWSYLPGPCGGMMAEDPVYKPGDPCEPPFFFSPGRLDNPCDRFHFWSLHQGGAHFLFVDGNVRFLSYSARSILPALATRAGGETVNLD